MLVLNLISLFFLATIMISSSEPKVFNGLEQRDISVHLREMFSILLHGNPTTGFSWVVDNLPEHVELIDERFTRDGAPEGFTGVGGVYNFTFKPRAIGDGAIRFKHHRVWEKDVPPIDTAELKCTVSED